MTTLAWSGLFRLLRSEGVGGCRGAFMFALRGWGDVDGCGLHMWPARPGRPGHVARTGPDSLDMWPGHAARTAWACGPGQTGHVWTCGPGGPGMRPGRTGGPDSPDRWPDGKSPGYPGCPGWVLRGTCRVGGFGRLMFEEVLGASMAVFFCL